MIGLKTFMLAAGILSANTSFADGNGVWAGGAVVYKHPNGQIVNRECSIFVPSMGRGDVALKCSNFEVRSREFTTERNANQVIFTVLFRDIEGAPEGAIAKYRGTYLRGTNQALYYGDVFSSLDAQADINSMQGWQYTGGFMFSKSLVENQFSPTSISGMEAEANSPRRAAPVRTVEYVDLNRYLGQWYEIASFPQSFQEGCTATTAYYSLKANGKIAVKNQCRLDSPDGPLKTANGTARVVDKESNAKLKVTFFWPFAGDYWILDLDPDYQWAVVGDPSRESLWILARTSTMEESLYKEITSRIASEQGFDISRLRKTIQPQL